MKSLSLFCYRLSFVFIIILAISCKKDAYVDEENELVYPVNFTFTNFKSSTNFLKTSSLKSKLFALIKYLQITVKDIFISGVLIAKT